MTLYYYGYISHFLLIHKKFFSIYLGGQFFRSTSISTPFQHTMSQPAAIVPAWKRLGLKVKENISKDPLTGQVQATKANTKANNKRQSPSTTTTDEQTQKKPPKRVKLPKADRKPPPEADQLVYLKQYHTDRANWKFSKQKQNWILRSVFGTPGSVGGVPDEYKAALMSYLEGLQGGARERIVEEAQGVVTQWNEFMTAPVEKPKDEEKEEEKEPEAEEATEPESTETQGKKEKAKPKVPEKIVVPPSEPVARLAKAIIKSLTGTVVTLELLEDEEVVEEATVPEDTTEPEVKTTEPEAEPEESEEEITITEKDLEKKPKKEKKDKKEKSNKKEKKEKKEKKDKKEKK